LIENFEIEEKEDIIFVLLERFDIEGRLLKKNLKKKLKRKLKKKNFQKNYG
jgi:hypothetical protein